MGVFTALGDPELDTICAELALGRRVRWEAIAAGTINSNFAVTTERGRWFVRVNEGKAEDDVAWEARLVEALAAAGVPAPVPIRARDGRPYLPLVAGGATKWVSAFAWQPGRHLAADEVTPHLAGELGAALGALHRAGAALPAAWRRPSIYDHAHLVARHAGFAGSADPALARALAVIAEELAHVDAAAGVRAGATTGIIHGDLFRDNVLWDGDRLVAILDFEQASGGSLAYDLAVCVNDWCWTGGAFDGALIAALVAGYERARPLAAGDRAALLIEVRAAAVRFTITRITDVYLARVDNPEKDFRAFLARCEAWQGQALGLLSSVL